MFNWFKKKRKSILTYTVKADGITVSGRALGEEDLNNQIDNLRKIFKEVYITQIGVEV